MAKKDKPNITLAGDNPVNIETSEFKVKDPVPEGAGVREKICAIHDGTIESKIMIHKLAKDGSYNICLLEGADNKFDKIELDSKVIEGIGAQDKEGILQYIKKCGQYCFDNNISKLFIPWATDTLNANKEYLDLFMNGVPTVLGELSTYDEQGKETKFVRSVFYWYSTATDDILKNKKQYGYQ